MKTSLFTVAIIAIFAVVIALLTVLAIGLYLPKSSSVSTPKTTFDLPGRLATAPMNSTNPYGCGPNMTDFFTFPAHSFLVYYVSDNASGSRVDYWTLGIGPPSPVTIVRYGNLSAGKIPVGSTSATIEFLFQGCGTTPTVPLGFWGNYTLPGSG